MHSSNFEARQTTLNALGILLESLVRDRISDESLGSSLDGLSFRMITPKHGGAMEIQGAFYTLSSRGGRTINRMLPMRTRLSSDPADVWTVWVGDADSQYEMGESEREIQRAFERTTWAHCIELRIT